MTIQEACEQFSEAALNLIQVLLEEIVNHRCLLIAWFVGLLTALVFS